MAIGAGIYDDICTMARVASHAEGIVLIVFNGKHGGGFSVQAPPSLLLKLPEMLRSMANDIDRDLGGGPSGH